MLTSYGHHIRDQVRGCQAVVKYLQLGFDWLVGIRKEYIDRIRFYWANGRTPRLAREQLQPLQVSLT